MTKHCPDREVIKFTKKTDPNIAQIELDRISDELRKGWSSGMVRSAEPLKKLIFNLVITKVDYE